MFLLPKMCSICIHKGDIWGPALRLWSNRIDDVMMVPNKQIHVRSVSLEEQKKMLLPWALIGFIYHTLFYGDRSLQRWFRPQTMTMISSAEMMWIWWWRSERKKCFNECVYSVWTRKWSWERSHFIDIPWIVIGGQTRRAWIAMRDTSQSKINYPGMKRNQYSSIE